MGKNHLNAIMPITLRILESSLFLFIILSPLCLLLVLVIIIPKVMQKGSFACSFCYLVLLFFHILWVTLLLLSRNWKNSSKQLMREMSWVNSLVWFRDLIMVSKWTKVWWWKFKNFSKTNGKMIGVLVFKKRKIWHYLVNFLNGFRILSLSHMYTGNS